MKILLINSPVRLNAKPNCIPYGLATIASVLRNHGNNVAIYDANALRPTRTQILETLKNMHWDVVGVSGLITTFEFQLWLIPHLKAMHPRALVVSGGGLATSNSDLLFDRAPLDIVAIGEGERTMSALCAVLNNGGDLKDVPGIRFRENGSIVRNRIRENIGDLDKIPYPSWDLIPMEVYLKNPIWGDGANNSSGFRNDVTVNRSMNIISSRGCPFTCKYCYHLFGRSSYRFRSAQNVFDEIELLVERYGVDFIGFVDDNMMASEGRALEFCDLMIRKKLPVTWGCHGRVTSAKPSLLRHMANAGCVWIGYGIESGSQKILDAMNKKTNVEQAKRAIRNTREAGIFANTTFIFGYPGETRETIQETVEFKRELGIDCGSFFATPYPGTPLYEEIKGRIVEEEAFVQSLGDANDFSINLTEFSNGELFRLKEAMDNNVDVM